MVTVPEGKRGKVMWMGMYLSDIGIVIYNRRELIVLTTSNVAHCSRRISRVRSRLWSQVSGWILKITLPDMTFSCNFIYRWRVKCTCRYAIADVDT